jgi:hypothetical protein
MRKARIRHCRQEAGLKRSADRSKRTCLSVYFHPHRFSGAILSTNIVLYRY